VRQVITPTQPVVTAVESPRPALAGRRESSQKAAAGRMTTLNHGRRSGTEGMEESLSEIIDTAVLPGQPSFGDWLTDCDWPFAVK
jgi:hypothetical protein